MERKFRNNETENPLLSCHLSELRGFRGCTPRGHNAVRNSWCLQQTEGLSLLPGSLWPSILSLKTLGRVLGRQPLIPLCRGQSGKAEHKADRKLQSNPQISVPLLITVGQTLPRVLGWGHEVTLLQKGTGGVLARHEAQRQPCAWGQHLEVLS